MGTAHAFTPEKLVVGMLAGREDRLGHARELLAERYGPIDLASDPVPFTFTRYYEREMGSGLLRQFLSFQRLVDPAALAEIKLATNDLEDSLRVKGARTVNLDPGILSLARFVLATTKESAHRIPLRAGIHAEVTLLFERGAFRPLAWTYPDYRSRGYLATLGAIRALYREQLRAGKG